MPLDLPTQGIGPLVAAVAFLRRIPKLWGLAAFEARLERDRAELIGEKAKVSLLIQKDAEIDASPTHGVSLGIEQMGDAYWQTEDMLEVNVYFAVRNPWIYPVTLVQVTGDVHFESSRRVCEFPTYSDEVEIAGLSARGVERKLRWTPSTQHKQRLQQIMEGQHGIAGMNLELRAYLLWRDGKRFQVSAQLYPKVVLYRPNP